MLASDETIEFLRTSFAPYENDVIVLNTHASVVFLGPDRVLKLKRPVLYPYLDFSTPEKRLAAVRKEYELNRRTAPELYLGAWKITRDRSGALGFDGSGQLIDAVVVMRKFRQEDLFDAMASRGDLTRTLVDELAARVARLHDEAPSSPDHEGARRVRLVLQMNDSALRSSGLASAERCDRLLNKFMLAFAKHRRLLDARAADGKVRRCHGDLTLRNICLFEGEITLFDCLEFNDDLATTDVLYDLAFVLMDLWRLRRRELANRCFNRYLDARDETDGLALAPFFMAIRACVRAHVGATQALDPSNDRGRLLSEALEYLAFAETFLDASTPRLVAIGGLSGSGKSTLSGALACEIGQAPGARVLSSDRVRKRLHGVPATTRLPADAYHPEVSRRVYTLLRGECGDVLDAGWSCVSEAVFDRPDEREAVKRVARHRRRAFTGLWMEAPAATAESRILSRRDDPSDATVEVLRQQARGDFGPISWSRIDAAGDVAQTLARARTIVSGPG